MELVLNGRFLTRSMSGVDRVATELMLAIMRQGREQPESAPALSRVEPVHDGTVAPQTRAEGILSLPRRASLPLRGQWWEQISLPVVGNGSWLLSLCNTGPVLRRRQVVLIHDAQVYDQPEAYSPLFRGLYRTLQPRLARRADLVLTVSDYSRMRLERNGVVPEGKAHVVHNGTDHILDVEEDATAVRRFNLTAKGYILAIGSLARHKNLGFLIAAAQARKSTEVPLVIAGGGNDKVFAKAGLREGNGVRILGRVSDGALKALYRNAQALAFPSKTEGFGLPAAEAMFCGCPVIATTGGAVPEVCGGAVRYADPDDQGAWTAALEEIAENPGLRADLAARGKRQVAQFTWRNAARKVLRHIAELEARAPGETRC